MKAFKEEMFPQTISNKLDLLAEKIIHMSTRMEEKEQRIEQLETNVEHLEIALDNHEHYSVRPKNKFESQGEVYKTVVRPAMMHGAETWAVKKAQEKKLDVAEMRMLRWMSGVTKLDRIRNERIRVTTKFGEISKKVQESRLKCYGHVLRRKDEYVGKKVMGMEVPGKRRRGRPKRRWLDSIRNALSERELSGDDVQDRPSWRRLTRRIDPT